MARKGNRLPQEGRYLNITSLAFVSADIAQNNIIISFQSALALFDSALKDSAV